MARSTTCWARTVSPPHQGCRRGVSEGRRRRPIEKLSSGLSSRAVAVCECDLEPVGIGLRSRTRISLSLSSESFTGGADGEANSRFPAARQRRRKTASWPAEETAPHTDRHALHHRPKIRGRDSETNPCVDAPYNNLGSRPIGGQYQVQDAMDPTALSKHETILKAFQATKRRLRDERDASPKRRRTLTRDSTVPVLQDRIRFLEDRFVILSWMVAKWCTSRNTGPNQTSVGPLPQAAI